MRCFIRAAVGGVLCGLIGVLFSGVLAGGSASAQVVEPTVLHERDFAGSPALISRPHEVVILELEPALRGKPTPQNLARYSLDAGTHTFCLDASEPEGTGLAVEDASGRRVLEFPLKGRQRPRGRKVDAVGERCARIELPSGTYQLSLTHDGRVITGASRVAFVQAGPPSPGLVDNEGRPAPGWWALRPDPTLDPERRPGRLTLGPTEPATGTRPVIADFASKQIDDASLFDFQDVHRPLVKASTLPLDLVKGVSSPYFTLLADADPSRTQTFFRDTAPLQVTDLGGYRAQLGVVRPDGQTANVFLANTPASATTVTLNYDQPRPDPGPPVPVEVLFRFFPDGTQIGELKEGEIAVFQECNYRGKAAVFAGRIPNLSELSSAVVTLDKSAASVRLGNNTGVILHTGLVYTGTRQIVEVDTPCLDATPIKSNTTTSLEVRLLAPAILLSTRSCVGCRLVGADLSDYDLSGVNLSGSDLTRANLTGTGLRNATLTNATLDEAVGFASADHTQIDLSLTSLKRIDFSNALLYGAKLNRANLEGANLSGAFLTNNFEEGNPDRQVRQAASLTGAHLKNVNLAGAHLSQADFGNASFYGDNAAADTACDTSQGFLNGCASAAKATMTGTSFNGAYLYGVDFQGATVKSVNFQNAVLVGASFADAELSGDPNQGLTRFTAAYLQGARLGDTRSMDNVSFQDAFVDFGANELAILLDGTHTAFHGWKTHGKNVCINVFYLNPTTVPETNSTLTCPDGTSGVCGRAVGTNLHWKSDVLDLTQTTPRGSYLLDSTYIKAAANPVCAPSDDDLDW